VAAAKASTKLGRGRHGTGEVGMDESTLATLGLLFFCGYLAYRLIRWIRPIVEQRKDLTPSQILDRAIMAPIKEQQRQALKFGSRKKTLLVHILNFALLLAWVYFGVESHVIFWGILGYQCAGFLVLRRIRLPTAEDLARLKANDRLWLRVFYAWFWPAYVPYIFLGK
jgi:hypothetical protein